MRVRESIDFSSTRQINVLENGLVRDTRRRHMYEREELDSLAFAKRGARLTFGPL